MIHSIHIQRDGKFLCKRRFLGEEKYSFIEFDEFSSIDESLERYCLDCHRAYYGILEDEIIVLEDEMMELAEWRARLNAIKN